MHVGVCWVRRICVVIHPDLELVLWRLGGKVGWFLPGVEDPANAWVIGVSFVGGRLASSVLGHRDRLTAGESDSARDKS